MASAIREGKATGTVSWSNGTAFNGYALIGLKTMVDGSGTAWNHFSLANYGQDNRLPTFTKILIADGQFNQATGLVYNADINPPGTQYVAWYYDSTGMEIAGPSTAFSVTGSTFSIPSLTLTVPSVGSNPTPDS